jgi:gluconate 2-dehydrogenase gamma chain
VRIFEPGPERFFDAPRKAQVAALFEAILPGGDDSPGASDADAAEYLSALLALGDDVYYEIPQWRALYEEALPALDAASASLHDRGVAELSLSERTELLRRLASGSLEGMPASVDQRRLFATLRGHCIEGCFADPRWRGNRDAVMWRWFGYLTPARAFTRDGDGALREVEAGGG